MNSHFTSPERAASQVHSAPLAEKRQSQLGFGCSMLMSRLNRSESTRLLEQAYDMGITHFDVARLYGYGEAESVLGDFAKKKRAKLTITTKVGILPPRKTALLTLAKAAARKLVKMSPGLRTKLRAKANGMTTAGHFDIPSITRSFETSLRELRTDYVDYLLLHECTLNDLESPELLRFLEDAKQQGKLKQFGLATDFPTTEEAVRHCPDYLAVLQFPSSARDHNIHKLPRHASQLLITHSALGICLNDLYEGLQQSAGAKTDADELEVDIREKSALAKLLVRHALTDNPNGIVLFSSTSERNIITNYQAFAEGPLPPTAMELVDRNCRKGGDARE